VQGVIKEDGRRFNNYRHGMKGSRLYSTWRNMKTRCLNQNVPNFINYGGVGITVCDDWLSFIPFMKWALSNGYTDKLTIDRADVHKGYTPGNCRFITTEEQSRNRKLIMRSNTSGYRGVSKIRGGKFASDVSDWRIDKRVHIGNFNSPIAAALVRDIYVIDHKLNLPLNFNYFNKL